MPAPERRRPLDLGAAAAITALALIACLALWLVSDARGTTSTSAEVPLSRPDSATAVPDSLAQQWHSISPETVTPLVASGAVVVADGGTVTGIDPSTGAPSWSYSRDLPLCGVTSAWSTAVTVFRDDRGCSQVTALDGDTGERRAQRTSDADTQVQLSEDGTYVTSRGDTRMELWRSDLVRTLEYGRIDAPVNPGAQPRSGCTLLSSASSTTRVAVLESCPGDSAPRLTTLNPAPDDDREPEEYGSSVVAALTGAQGPVMGATVVAASGTEVAVAVPAHADRAASIAVFDGNAQPRAQFDLPGPLAGSQNFDRSLPTVTAANVVSWWSGSGIVALSQTDLSPRWTMPGALGPGALMAGRLLVPVPNGIAVVDSESGSVERTIAVDRGDYTGPVGTAVTGNLILEQRGSDVVALSQAR